MKKYIQNFCIAVCAVALLGWTGATKAAAQTWCALGNSIDVSGNVLTSHLTMDSYQWVRCPIDIPGANLKTYKVVMDGDYMLRTVQGSCWDTVACITITTTGIHDLEQEPTLAIYPNPSRGTVTVSSKVFNGPAYMQVRDVLGRVQVAQTLHFEQYRTNFSLDLPKGYYTLVFRDEEGRAGQSGILME